MIKLIGAYAHGNIGDRLGMRMLRGWIETWTNRNVEMIGYKKYYTPNDVKELDHKCTAIVIGVGGQLLDWDGGPLLWMDTSDLYQYVNCPIIIWSTGFNWEYNAPLPGGAKTRIRALLQHVDLAGFRTMAGVKYAVRMGLSKDKAYFCPDPLLFVGSEGEGYIENKVGVVVAGYGITNRLLKAIDGLEYVVIDHEDSKVFRFDVYRDCDFIVGSGFHAGVLAFGFNKPYFGVDANVKHGWLRKTLYPDDLRCHGSITYMNRLDKDFESFLEAKEFMRKYSFDSQSFLWDDYYDFAVKASEVIR